MKSGGNSLSTPPIRLAGLQSEQGVSSPEFLLRRENLCGLRLDASNMPHGNREVQLPEPAEEILGAPAAGKMYVFAGLAPVWKPIGMVYEYDPASNHWTKKKPMALASHHVAFTEYHGKIYGFGGFVLPDSGPPAWAPINNAWEYDPATDAWKALAPLPSKRGSAVAAAMGDKIYVIGGVTTIPGSNITAMMPTTPQMSVGTVEEYDPASNSWRQRSPMPTPRNHAAAGVVNGKIYVIGGRVGAAFIGLATDI